jgi:two-component system cell cycle sensor histidine kinase/response regulator CckA
MAQGLTCSFRHRRQGANIAAASDGSRFECGLSVDRRVVHARSHGRRRCAITLGNTEPSRRHREQRFSPLASAFSVINLAAAARVFGPLLARGWYFASRVAAGTVSGRCMLSVASALRAHCAPVPLHVGSAPTSRARRSARHSLRTSASSCRIAARYACTVCAPAQGLRRASSCQAQWAQTIPWTHRVHLRRGLARLVHLRRPTMSMRRNATSCSDVTVGERPQCHLLREYQRLLKAGGGAENSEAQALRAQLEETLCGHAHALEAVQASLRQSEAQFRHAQKMEAVGLMAGGVAHDFNNVLSVILASTELLLEDLKSNDPIRDDVQLIREAGVRGAGLTHQLLMFSRRQMIGPKVVDTQSLLTDIEKMLRRILGEDVTLTCQVETPAPRVMADPGLLEQVLVNLAVNARDAMPGGGRLDIEVSSLVLSAPQSADIPAGSYAVVTVTDTGSGMDAATQARIFEPFFTTKEPGRGTGLGLSTVFGIVQQSGGSISVCSELGKGTRFLIYLPSVTAQLGPEQESPPPRSARGSETVLVVDDEDSVRTVASSVLRRHGYTVIQARNAGEALLACEKHPSEIHLLLADVVMPQMSGPELAVRLAGIRPDMRVLFMSGHPNEAIEAVGPNSACLQKPLTVGALTRKVREALDATRESSRRRAASAA